MASRPRGSRPLRTLLAAFVVTAVVVPVSGAARPAAVPAPTPKALAPLRSAAPGALAERYAVNREGIRAAERMAEGHGDRARAGVLREMAARRGSSCSSTAATEAAPPRSTATWHGPSGSPYWCRARTPTSTGTHVCGPARWRSSGSWAAGPRSSPGSGTGRRAR